MHKWQFKARFRSGAYPWNGTALASKRLREAVSEIKKVAREDPLLAAEGVMALFERLWPAFQHIDSSSGALGSAVNRTVEALITILIQSPAEGADRKKMTERLYQAICDDGVSFLWLVEEHWGAICGSVELASEWADRILEPLEQSWGAEHYDPLKRVKSPSLCLSALFHAERYSDIQKLQNLRSYKFWSFDQFWARVLVQQGRLDEALAFAESRQHHDREENIEILEFCEGLLLNAGRSDEAYKRYGLKALAGGTYLSIFRKLVKKYPDRAPRQILEDLIASHGERGKWFAAAKDAGFLDIALQCASTSTVEPATLIRAARDFQNDAPEFAHKVALQAIHLLLDGYGYDPLPSDIVSAYQYLMAAAVQIDAVESTQETLKRLLRNASAKKDTDSRVMTSALKRCSGLGVTKG